MKKILGEKTILAIKFAEVLAKLGFWKQKYT